MCPVEAVSSPFTSRMKVDLPAPDDPMTATNSPGSMATDRGASASSPFG